MSAATSSSAKASSSTTNKLLNDYVRHGMLLTQILHLMYCCSNSVTVWAKALSVKYTVRSQVALLSGNTKGNCLHRCLELGNRRDLCSQGDSVVKYSQSRVRGDYGTFQASFAKLKLTGEFKSEIDLLKNLIVSSCATVINGS